MSTSNRPLDTAGDHGPVINVVTWVLLVSTTLAMIARIATKLAVRRKLDRSDVVMGVSYVRNLLLDKMRYSSPAKVCSLGQSISICIATSNGLGRHIITLRDEQLDRFQRVSLLGCITSWWCDWPPAGFIRFQSAKCGKLKPSENLNCAAPAFLDARQVSSSIHLGTPSICRPVGYLSWALRCFRLPSPRTLDVLEQCLFLSGMFFQASEDVSRLRIRRLALLMLSTSSILSAI